MELKKLNLVLGWATFLLALVVYLLTLEPTVSLWDCGEFIASSYKLQVGHPPGAPFYLIIGRFFSLFASDPARVAMMINAVSAFASAFTILFLFWTISHLLQKMTHQLWVILGGSLVGALAYTFSDTFWFSAVEGEVYATSSLFTAVVFWAILKWENAADEPGANRWLILIAYLIGLSIGVHLLNLLAIPAIVLVYYFRKYQVTRKGVIYALGISLAILLFIMYGIIPGIVKMASWFELLFTNGIGLHYNTGLVIYVLLLLGGLAYGIYRTQYVKKSALWNTVWLSITVILIGYSSYALIVIRSQAAPPMNENRPENVFALLSYLNREQYGDRPLVRGHLYDAQVKDIQYTKPVYVLNKEENRYEIAYKKPELEMRGSKMLFPRMYSREANHRQAYEEYGTIKDPENPSLADNLEFFLRYQVGHMYLRYFMWNFAGRQNDIQGHGNVLNGNWISGIRFIDSMMVPQKMLPQRMKDHPARNTYFFLPFLLGLLGLFYQLDRNLKDFWVVMSLFILTGLAIVVYLNQTPYQPRERDYAYAGSFYAFSIWIGVGVAGLYKILNKMWTGKGALVASLAIGLFSAPVLMAVQNWDDHDRSGRYTARDIAANYLKSCDENAILFTVGDNDTFPLWYVQDVEGVREDVRIVNMMLFNMDWYIDQMRWKNYTSDPLAFTLPPSKYRDGTNNSVYVRENEGSAPLDYIMTFVKSDDPRTKLPLRTGDQVDYIPTHQVYLPLDSLRRIDFNLKPNAQILKGSLAQLDVFSSNFGKRPIYYTAGGFSASLGLEPYYVAEGLAFRVGEEAGAYSSILDMGQIDAEKMYQKLMHEFSWGRMNAEDVHLDYSTIRTLSVIRFRSLHTNLALELLEKGERLKAIEVLDRCMELAPSRVLPFDQYVSGITIPDRQGGVVHYEGLIEAYYLCGEMEKGNDILREYYLTLAGDVQYFNAMHARHRSSIQRDINEALFQMEELQNLLVAYQQTDLLLELGINAPGS